MSGDRVELARADDVWLELGGIAMRHDVVAIADLGAFIPPALGEVHGALSLATFATHPVTLDLPQSRLVLETPDSLATRAAQMDALRVRCARPVGGLALDLFVEVESPRGPLFLEIDSGCTGPTILAPHAAESLGLGKGEPGSSGDVDLPLRGAPPVTTSWEVGDVIHDGVVGLSVLNQRALTLDLETGRAWLSRHP